MFGQTLAIARNTFVESIRQPIFFVLVVVSGILQVFNTMLSAFSMGYTEEIEVSGDDKMLLDMGLATVLVCATLLAAFVATSVLSREIENKTALTVISKPIGRPLFVLGKYLGVASAIVVATVIMLAFFLFAINHEVMSTARDEVHGPVILFSTTAVLFSIGLAVWANYFYGWVFSSTAIVVMLPAVLIGYGLSLVVGKEWAFQPITEDFKPQITIAAGCVLMAMLVLTSIAVAASTRLGQVMTIVVCAGVFLLGLLSNYLLGRYAFQNDSIATIQSVEVRYDDILLDEAGDRATVTFERPPRIRLEVGDSFYFGPDPSGVAMAVPAHAEFTGEVTADRNIVGPEAQKALVVAEIGDQNQYTILNAGGLAVARLPREGDFVFAEPTTFNWPARGAWSVVPNLQFFWMVDAITQGHEITGRYLGLVAVYSGVQIIGFLALGVMLFQRRDVG